MTIKVSLLQLRAVIDDRPAGYFDEVTRSGRTENGVLFIEQDVYLALRKKYSPPQPPPIAGVGGLPVSAPPANLAGAAFRLAKAAMKGEKVRASQGEIDRRLAICKTSGPDGRACEFFVDNPMKCRKCGCFLNLKTRLETEHCPIKKW